MEAAERAKQNLRSLTCYHPSRREEWRDNDWFKTRVPDQTPSRPRFIQSVSDLCRPRSLDPTRTNSIQFSSQWVGRRPMSNSVESHGITRLESVGPLESHFHPYGWAAGPWELITPRRWSNVEKKNSSDHFRRNDHSASGFQPRGVPDSFLPVKHTGRSKRIRRPRRAAETSPTHSSDQLRG